MEDAQQLWNVRQSPEKVGCECPCKPGKFSAAWQCLCHCLTKRDENLWKNGSTQEPSQDLNLLQTRKKMKLMLVPARIDAGGVTRSWERTSFFSRWAVTTTFQFHAISRVEAFLLFTVNAKVPWCIHARLHVIHFTFVKCAPKVREYGCSTHICGRGFATLLLLHGTARVCRDRFRFRQRIRDRADSSTIWAVTRGGPVADRAIFHQPSY